MTAGADFILVPSRFEPCGGCAFTGHVCFDVDALMCWARALWFFVGVASMMYFWTRVLFVFNLILKRILPVSQICFLLSANFMSSPGLFSANRMSSRDF
jgi:hypothetical protein